MTALLLSGCATATPTTALPSLHERPVTKACLTDPPPVTDTFNTSMCKTLLSIDEDVRDRDRERARLERARLNELRAPKSGSTSESGLTTEEKPHLALRRQANEAGRQFRQQYIAAKRPVLRLKFRHEYPTMSEEEIEVLVNDALEDGLREAGETERRRLFGGPGMRPPVSCTSYNFGMFTNTDCY